MTESRFKTSFCAKLLISGSLLVSCAWADSIGAVWALQQGAGVSPSYANASNVLMQGVPLLGPTLLNPWKFRGDPAYLAFRSTVEGSGVLGMRLEIGGVEYETGGVFGGPECVGSFVLPRGFYRPTAGVLTVSFGGESRTFDFYFVEPVPEPGTWGLLVTGLGLIGLGRAWR